MNECAAGCIAAITSQVDACVFPQPLGRCSWTRSGYRASEVHVPAELVCLRKKDTLFLHETVVVTELFYT